MTIRTISHQRRVSKSVMFMLVVAGMALFGCRSWTDIPLSRTGYFSPGDDVIACVSRYGNKNVTVSLVYLDTLDSELVLTNIPAIHIAYLPDIDELSVVKQDGIYYLDMQQRQLVLKQGAAWMPEDNIQTVSMSCRKVFGKKRLSRSRTSSVPFFIIDMQDRHRTEFCIPGVNPANVTDAAVFARDDSFLVVSDGRHVFKVEDDGETITCLTKQYEGREGRIGQRNSGSMHIDVSTDGDCVAFSTKSAAYVMRSDGSALKKVVDCEGSGWIFGLRFSPDNKRIFLVILGQGNGSMETGVYSAETNGNHIELLDNEFPYSQVGVSHDGSRIVFEGGSRNGRVLFVMNADGTHKVRLFPRIENLSGSGGEARKQE